MKAFPMFIKTTNRRVIVVGGGEQAAQKARLVLKSDATLILASPVLEDELADLVASGRATHHAGPVTPAFLHGAAMVFIATGCVGADHAYHGLAKAAGALVNVVDQPALCDMTTPSIVDRDPVIVAIGTEGTAPVLARQIKTQLEQALPQNLGGLAALAGRLRARVAARVHHTKRRAFWRWVFTDSPRRLWEAQDEDTAMTEIDSAIDAGAAPEHSTATSVAFVGAGSGAVDLMTLRGLQRLQEADVIYFDAGSEAVLELARRDAERVQTDQRAGAWPLNRQLPALVADASKGPR